MLFLASHTAAGVAAAREFWRLSARLPPRVSAIGMRRCALLLKDRLLAHLRREPAGRVADAQPAKYVLLFDLDDARKTATTSLLCTAPHCYCAVSTMGWPSTCVRILVRASYVWNVYRRLARAREDQRRAKNWHLDELNLNPMGWAHRSSHTTSEGFMLTYKHQFIISYASGGPIPPGARSSPPQACRRAAGAPAGGLRPAASAFWRPPSARSCPSGS